MENKKSFQSYIYTSVVASLSLLFLFIFFVLSLFAGEETSREKDSGPLFSSTVSYEKEYKEEKRVEGVSAKSYVVYDPLSGTILLGYHSDQPLALASLTKIMTAYVAYMTLGPLHTVQIHSDDLSVLGDSGLVSSDVWTAQDLIQYTISVSSNDGARALARTAGETLVYTEGDTAMALRAFYRTMNETAKRYGMETMRFYNETGLDVDKSTNGGYGSAQDVARLLGRAYFVYPELFDTSTQDKATLHSRQKVYTAQNTNVYAGSTPGLSASKTGYTDLAQGNLATVVENDLGRPLVVVVLGSTKEARFSDAEKLVREASLFHK